jgi:hypothetical protein
MHHLVEEIFHKIYDGIVLTDPKYHWTDIALLLDQSKHILGYK